MACPDLGGANLVHAHAGNALDSEELIRLRRPMSAGEAAVTPWWGNVNIPAYQ